jgi:hypothetical protein
MYAKLSSLTLFSGLVLMAALLIPSTSFAETNRFSRAFCLKAHGQFLNVQGHNLREVKVNSPRCKEWERFSFERWGGNPNELAIKSVAHGTYLNCLPNPPSAGRNVHGDAGRRQAWEQWNVSSSDANGDRWNDHHGSRPHVTIRCTAHGGNGYLAVCGSDACNRGGIKPKRDAVWQIIWQENW